MDIVILSYLTPDLTIATTQTYTRNDLNDDIRSIIIVENSSKTNYLVIFHQFLQKLNVLKITPPPLAWQMLRHKIASNIVNQNIFSFHSDSAILSPLFFDSLNHYISKVMP